MTTAYLRGVFQKKADMTRKQHIDIERMVMRTCYELSLKSEQPVSVENPKVMEYEKRIND